MDFHGYSEFEALQVRALDIPSIRPQTASRNRRIARPRAPVEVMEGLEIALVPDGSLDWFMAGKPIDIAFTVAGEAGYITTVVPVVQRLLARAGLGLRPEQLDAELAALVIEAVLAERIEALESFVGGEIALLNLDRTHTRGTLASLSFDLRIPGGGAGYPGSIHGSAALLSMIARRWEERPALRREHDAIPLTLAYRVAFTDLSSSALLALAVGDAMLFDRIAVPGGAAVVLAEAMHATARFSEEGFLHLSTPFIPPERYALGDFLMSEETDPDRPVQAIADSDIDGLPIRLVFEVGRQDVTLDELRSLAVGAPMPLDRPASSAVQIFANGRRVGAGEMVMIGDQLGVRITQLNSNA